MKKTTSLLITLLLAVLGSVTAHAQIEGFGFVGGYTSSNARLTADDLIPNAVASYHAGITQKFNIGLGFAIQPSLLYQVKSADVDLTDGSSHMEILGSVSKDFLDARMGYVEMPLQFQWGPDLMAFRPYVFAEPFVGYGLDVKADSVVESVEKDWHKANINRWEWGLGLGGGLEIWRFQITAKYFWNFGRLCDEEGNINVYNVSETVGYAFRDKRNFNGVSVSLAFLFGNSRRR